ncbi:MAG: DUF3592 domain-containing protein [Solirubrobacteraceae bacterium]|nr:DUF3592 domain-containing protein [Solirubrobacteraceae bacterium]
MMIASTATDVLIAGGVGLLFVCVGMAVIWPWFRLQKALVEVRMHWLEAEAEVVAFRPIPMAEWPQWEAIYAFEASRDRHVRGPARFQKTLNDRGELGARRTVLYNPKNAREFTTGDVSHAWTDLLWGTPFLLAGLTLWIAPLFL